MKVFIWQQVKNATGNWHPEGGVVVIAEQEARARELATAEGCLIAEDELPDHIYDIAADDEHVIIFPDAGCC